VSATSPGQQGQPGAWGQPQPPQTPPAPQAPQTSFSPQPTFNPVPSQSTYGQLSTSPTPATPAAPAAAAAPYGVPAGSPTMPATAPSAPAGVPAQPYAPSQSAPSAPTATNPAAPMPPSPPASAPASPPLPQSRPAGPQPPSAERASRPSMGQVQQTGDISLDEVLSKMVEAGASDLHLTSGAPPMVRLAGALTPLEGFDQIDGESLRRSLYSILTQRQREHFEAELELDFAYALRGKARFRVNLYQQRDSIGAAFRVIPYEIKALEDLGVPPVVGSFANLPRGLVLVTGPTGSGKSTTLAAIIDLANRTRPDHIMTVEDPIEFLHRHKMGIVNQREVGEDTHSFANALKHVLRQDPDIILVGEMRDLETISVALTAAETGHLVFATLHTQDAAQTIDRVIDVFPSHQQQQVRTQLAASIQGVVCQTLCKRADGPGRAVATEVLVATPAIRNLIREGKTHQIYSAMQAGAQQGMHTMDQHLAELVKIGKISYETGLEKCHHVEDFNRLTGRFSGGGGGGAGAANQSWGQ